MLLFIDALGIRLQYASFLMLIEGRLVLRLIPGLGVTVKLTLSYACLLHAKNNILRNLSGICLTSMNQEYLAVVIYY